MKTVLCIIAACFFSHHSAAQGNSDTIPLIPAHYESRVAQFKKEPPVKSKTIFLGDGFVESGKWRRLLNDSSVINRGIKGDISSGVLLRLPDVIVRQPARVYIMVGGSDLLKRLPDETIQENIFSAVTRIKKGVPGVVLYVQGILPVNPTAKNFSGSDNNDHAVVINAQLQKYADRLGYTYVDLYPEFSDDRGHLAASYSADGTNLNPAGYAHWIEILKRKKCL